MDGAAGGNGPPPSLVFIQATSASPMKNTHLTHLVYFLLCYTYTFFCPARSGTWQQEV